MTSRIQLELKGHVDYQRYTIPQQYSVLCLSAYKFRFIDKAYLKVNDKVPNHVKCVITGLLLSPGVYTPSAADTAVTLRFGKS